MDNENIRRLLSHYNNGEASEAETREIEALLASGEIALEDLSSLGLLEEQLAQMEAPPVGNGMDTRFYAMLAREKRAKEGGRKLFVAWPAFAPGLAAAAVTLILGFFGGYFLGSSAVTPGDQRVEALSRQVSSLQEMMMLSLLEKGSATERLKAVNLTREMSEASRKVTTALLATLNADENVNVRLAALEALKPYTANREVREALVLSIGRQESPLVQVSMAELMVALQEKSAVKEFQKIIESDKTPPPVKEKIRESIDVLI